MSFFGLAGGAKQGKHIGPSSALDFFAVRNYFTMAAVRLRRALNYPEESDGDSGREELDEQDQEQIILRLQRQNDARNAQYSV